MRASKSRWVLGAAMRPALWFCACHVLLTVGSGQCTNPTQVPNQTISSGTVTYTDNNALRATGVTINGSASVTFVAGNCIELGPGFRATAGTSPTTFHAWVETAPSAVSVSPASGSGASSPFTWTVSSPSGYGNLSEMQAIFNTSLSGVNACYVQYLRGANLLKVADINGSNWSSGVVPGSSDTTGNFNPYCTINGIGSGVSSSGAQLSVTASITFQSAFAGAKNSYLIAYDQHGLNSSWQQVGTWTVGGTPGTPTISGLSPSAGAAGTPITIGGANFSTSGTVTFNGVAASTASWTTNSITAIVPAGATSGNVIVTAGGVSSNGWPFTVTSAPTITGISPSAGPVGAAATISGSNFGATGAITFNGVAATATNWGATSISTSVPAGATSGNVVVTVGGVPSNGVPFSVTTAPLISSLSATSGPAGASIIISGANFGSSQGTNTVRFNGTVSSVSSWSATSVTTTVPAGATSGNVIVTVGGVASNGVFFTVNSAPGITSVTPNAGPVGAPVVISGTNFGATQGSSTVTFNGASATATSWSATSISVTVPAGASSGNVVVAVGVASNGVPFTVTQAPNVSGLSPSSGQAGTLVIISGSGFGGAQGTSTVRFNGVAATVSSWSATSITTAVPGGATSGNVIVTVAGVASNGVFFAVATGPTIISISPSWSPIGATVTITGANFGAAQGSSTVTFNGTPAAVSVWSATSISAIVPAGATSGNVVVTVSGAASNGFEFSVFPPPVITGLAPVSGAVGTAVTITGSNFGEAQGASSVRFNGTTAAVTSWSATSIISQAPAGATTGLVSVVVNGAAAYSPQSFTVNTTVEPNITSISPSAAPAGASVTITGANFGSTQGTSTVTFNGVQATAISWSNNSIVAAVPASASSGNVVVQVSSLSSNPISFTVGAAPPTREYIRMMGRVVAIENSAPQVLPTITSLSVTSGTAGTAVTITGNNFGASPRTVTFNGTAAVTTSWSATSISTTVPAGATTGNVVVTVNGYSSNGVMFSVAAPETVSTPTTPAGPASGLANAVYTYTASGSVSSHGNPVQYIFYWGDGTNSGWLPSGATAASHTWTSAGTWAVTVQARSAPNPTVLSAVSPPRSMSVISGYANLSISSAFQTYDSWTMSLYTNVPNTWFSICAIFPDGHQTCTENWGQTNASGFWTQTGSFPPGNAGAWREWVEFPTAGVRSNDIVFTVSDFATLSISSGFHAGNSWTLSLHTSIPNAWFSICAIFPDGHQTCTENWGQTDASGNWTSAGWFSQSDLGSWQEWVVFPTATSNSIYFTVSP